MLPFVSVIIPCRNEEKYIVQCVDSVLSQGYPVERFELLLADGMSEDKTRSIMQEYARRYAHVRWYENPGRSQTKALNILIGQAKGDVIIRLDAHSSFPADYVSNCVKYLEEYKVDNVGGLWETCPGADTLFAKAVALALTSPFGVGGARFRIGVDQPTLVETVPFGCYRRDVFTRIGFFNENMVRNEDNEFNSRLTAAGGKILLHPKIKCRYFARSTLFSMVRQKFQDGFWCVYGIKFVGKRAFFPRHLIPMAFVSVVVLSLILGCFVNLFLWIGFGVLSFYLIGMLTATSFLVIKNGVQFFPFLLIIFPCFHFPYGLGSLCGVIRILVESAGMKKGVV